MIVAIAKTVNPTHIGVTPVPLEMLTAIRRNAVPIISAMQTKILLFNPPFRAEVAD